jgi:hypothetical protein
MPLFWHNQCSQGDFLLVSLFFTCTNWLFAIWWLTQGFYPLLLLWLCICSFYEQNFGLLMIISVYLTPAPSMSCWCRGLLLVDLVCLPCSSLQACESWLVSGGCWNRWSSSCCSPVLAVLDVFLLFLPWCSLSMEWLGFGCEQLMYASPLLLWSTARPGPFWWLSQACVLWGMHTS